MIFHFVQRGGPWGQPTGQHICACVRGGRGSKIDSRSAWIKPSEVNLTGTLNVVRLCAAQIAKNTAVTGDGGPGVVINVASIAAYEGQFGQAAYSASRGSIIAMTLLARDQASIGMRVNTIVPGLIDTPLFSGATPDIICSIDKNR